MNRKELQSGDYLFHEGDAANCIYLLLHGRVSIRKSTGNSAVEIGQVGASQVIGELAFFDRQPRSADAVMITAGEVAEIPFTALDTIYKQAPDYLKRIMISLATRLREADETIKELKATLGHEVSTGNGQPRRELSEVERVLAMTSNEKKPGPTDRDPGDSDPSNSSDSE